VEIIIYAVNRQKYVTLMKHALNVIHLGLVRDLLGLVDTMYYVLILMVKKFVVTLELPVVGINAAHQDKVVLLNLVCAVI